MKTRDQRQEQLRDFGELFDMKSRPSFDGVTYEPKFDATRLRGEMARVYQVMIDHRWHTLNEIQEWIVFRGGPVDSEAGVSARLRDLRKAKFGSHTVNRRRRGDPSKGIFEYQLL